MLKMGKLPGTLPAGTDALLDVLEEVVPKVAYRPGADAEDTVYQQGARDLVDLLRQRWNHPVAEEELRESGEWYDSYGDDMRDYIEGDD